MFQISEGNTRLVRHAIDFLVSAENFKSLNQTATRLLRYYLGEFYETSTNGCSGVAIVKETRGRYQPHHLDELNVSMGAKVWNKTVHFLFGIESQSFQSQKILSN